MAKTKLSLQQARSLKQNLTNSLAQIRDSTQLLKEMEAALPDASPEDVSEFLKRLQDREGYSESLATERNAILSTLAMPETGLSVGVLMNALPLEIPRPQFAERIRTLRTALFELRRQKERVWTIINVRSCVIDLTLGVLTGGTAYGYDSKGEHSMSRSRPVFQHRC